jgi:hypothetical protein
LDQMKVELMVVLTVVWMVGLMVELTADLMVE